VEEGLRGRTVGVGDGRHVCLGRLVILADACNHGPLSVLDAAFLELAPVATMRVFNRVPRKGGALPEARLANARLTALTPGDVVIEPQGRRVLKQTDEGGGRVRVRMGLSGRRLTHEYVAQITRFLFKATLGFICFDHGPDRALDPALDEVGRIVLGEPFHGYLVAGNTAIPDQQIDSRTTSSRSTARLPFRSG
jgi:hypothetical protein